MYRTKARIMLILTFVGLITMGCSATKEVHPQISADDLLARINEKEALNSQSQSGESIPSLPSGLVIASSSSVQISEPVDDLSNSGDASAISSDEYESGESQWTVSPEQKAFFDSEPVLEAVFMEATDDYVNDLQGDRMWLWVENKCRNQDIESIINYAEACKQRGYFDRDCYTAPNPLIVVIRTNYDKGFDRLVALYPELIDLPYCTGKYGECIETPLHMAVKYRNTHAVTELIARGVDVNSRFSEGVNYSPIYDNLISICEDPEIQDILTANGVKYFYDCSLSCKLYGLTGTTVKLFKESYESSEYIEYLVDEKTNNFKTEEIGFITYSYMDPTKDNYIPISRWVRVSGNGVSGWVRPNETHISFSYYEP